MLLRWLAVPLRTSELGELEVLRDAAEFFLAEFYVDVALGADLDLHQQYVKHITDIFQILLLRLGHAFQRLVPEIRAIYVAQLLHHQDGRGCNLGGLAIDELRIVQRQLNYIVSQILLLLAELFGVKFQVGLQEPQRSGAREREAQSGDDQALCVQDL